MEGNLRFKIDWASPIVGGKFAVFALFYSVFEGNFPSTSPPGEAYIWRGELTEGFLRYKFEGLMEGLIHGGSYFQNFTVFQRQNHSIKLMKHCLVYLFLCFLASYCLEK